MLHFFFNKIMSLDVAVAEYKPTNITLRTKIFHLNRRSIIGLSRLQITNNKTKPIDYFDIWKDKY